MLVLYVKLLKIFHKNSCLCLKRHHIRNLVDKDSIESEDVTSANHINDSFEKMYL